MSADLPAAPLPPRLELPAALAERARRLASGELTPAPPRAAATVVLLRDGADGVEAFLQRRVRTMAFAPGVHVFPGGSVDPRDLSLPDGAWAGPPPAGWADLLSADEPLTRALVCAAVRETFEETGVLLAGPSADTVVADVRDPQWEADRQALVDRSLAFADFLQARQLVLRADLLRPWAHWITPIIEERRYDTRFFLAELPRGQLTQQVGTESERGFWVRPGEAVDRHNQGEFAMLPPTIFTLRELSAYDRTAAAMDAGTARDIQPRLPQVVVDADTAALLLPHEET
jgi:8-oxo-dGTP pyrophosphatase MutT (NUDIX family)